MNFITFWKTLFCFAWLPLYFSSNKATTASTTNNIDQRMAQESGAVGASASGGSTVNITTLDGGAISEAFGLANHSVDGVLDFATSSNSASHHTAELALQGALSSIADTKDAFQQAQKATATAYEDAKIGNRSIMTVGVLLLGGVIVVVALSQMGNK